MRPQDGPLTWPLAGVPSPVGLSSQQPASSLRMSDPGEGKVDTTIRFVIWVRVHTRHFHSIPLAAQIKLLSVGGTTQDLGITGGHLGGGHHWRAFSASILASYGCYDRLPHLVT